MKKRVWRLLALCFALGVLLAAVPPALPSARADDEDTDFQNIYTVEDLTEMSGKRGTYYLRNDLDLTNWGNWTPISCDKYCVFDGLGHTIRGIKVAGNESVGLFHTVNGTVRNLHIEVTIAGDAGAQYVGGLAGENFGNIEYVSVSSQIDIDTDSTSLVGGLVGNNEGAITHSSVSGKVSVTVSSDDRNNTVEVGGLTGFNHYGNIDNCWSSTDVLFNGGPDKNDYYRWNGFCGGLAGDGNGIHDCYVIGSIILNLGNREYRVNQGGIVPGDGYERCYYCNPQGGQIGGGTYKTESAMKQQYTYVGWDFLETWAISPDINNGFPYLREPKEVHPTSVTISANSLTMKEGVAQMLLASVLPGNTTADHLDWFVSDTDIVELTTITDDLGVEVNGRVMITAKAPGTAVVSAVATDRQVSAACTVTVEATDADSPLPPPYRLNSVTVQDTSGEALNAVPTGSFLATVSVTNIASDDTPTIMLAAYTAEGQYAGLLYLTMKSPVGGTIEATLPVDNPDGKITSLKAFAVKSLSDLVILGSPVSFPAG